MKRPFFSTKKMVYLGLFLIFGPFGGCALFQESPDVEPEMPRKKQWNQQYDVLVKESRAEADRLRSELATIKIAAAKNNGGFQPTQRGMSQPGKKEKELASEVETLKADITTLKEERDQLRHQNAQLQARSEALPGMRQLVMDIKALQTSVHQLVTKMESLSTDIIQVKQDIAIQEQTLETLPSRLTSRSVLEPPDPGLERPVVADTATAPPKIAHSTPQGTTITVEWGDTLWDIARTHDISVNQLKEMNDLTSDSIFEGQQLEVPLSQTQPSQPEPPAALAAQKGEKPSNEPTANEGASDAKEGP